NIQSWNPSCVVPGAIFFKRPIGQLGTQGSGQGQRLVEHDVMTAVGQLYDRHKPAKAAARVGPSLAIAPLAMLADAQRNTAAHIEQRLGELQIGRASCRVSRG